MVGKKDSWISCLCVPADLGTGCTRYLVKPYSRNVSWTNALVIMTEGRHLLVRQCVVEMLRNSRFVFSGHVCQ